MHKIDNPDFVVTSSNLFCPGDAICQWVYNKPKYKKSGKPETRRKKIGYVVAGKDDEGTIFIGWSKCTAHDAFNTQLAKEIAFGRLMTGTDTPLPAAFKNFLPDFILRCKKYFQSDVIRESDFYHNTSSWDQQ